MAGESAPDDTSPGDHLTAVGADLAEAPAGSALGLIGGPVGAFGGAALGITVQRAARSIVGRLTDREEARAGAALVIIDDDTRAREQEGDRLRDDDFFDADGDLRSDAEELLEGVLRHAAASFEERKVPLLAHLYAAVAHDESVSVGDAQFLLRAASEMTFRQFVALTALTYGEDAYRTLLDEASVRIHEDYSRSDPALLAELDDLGRRSLVGVLGQDGNVADPTTLWGGSPLSTMNLRRIRPTPSGARLCELTDAVDVVSEADVRQWLAGLDGSSGR